MIVPIVVVINTMIVGNYYGNTGKKSTYSANCSGRVSVGVNYVKFMACKKFV